MVMALDGITVLDLTRLAPGPFCSMLLADFGADVLVVEAVPGSSQKLMQNIGGGNGRDGRATVANPLGRGKRSIALNLKDPAARDVFYELVKTADVVLEGSRPGVAKRLGVDHDTLAAINPRVISCSISGFGQTGPYANAVGHDLNYIALAGVLGATGWPGQPPAMSGLLIADFAGGGLTAAFAICLAIIAREKTGRGQFIDLSMSDAVLALMTSPLAGVLGSGQFQGRGEGVLGGGAPFYNVYETADGKWFSLASVESHFYDNLAEVLNLPELRGEEYNRDRWPEFHEKIAAAMKTKTSAEWEALLVPLDIAAAPVLDLDEVVTHPHNLARGMVVELDSPFGTVKQVGVGPKLSETPGGPRSTAPATGEHTDDVLRALGLSDARIVELRASGAAG